MMVDLYDLKKAVDDMVKKHENGIDAASTRVSIWDGGRVLFIHQKSEYSDAEMPAIKLKSLNF